MLRHPLFLLFVFASFTILSIKCSNSRQPNIIVKANNMTDSMRDDAIRLTKQAFLKFNGYSPKSRSAMVHYIRQQFEKLHQPSWQCILGRDYALSIASENEKRIILEADRVAILIFKGKC